MEPVTGWLNLLRVVASNQKFLPVSSTRLPLFLVQPLQSAVDCTTLLMVLMPEYTVNGLPVAQSTVPAICQPPITWSRIAGIPERYFFPLPNGTSYVYVPWKTCRRSKSDQV